MVIWLVTGARCGVEINGLMQPRTDATITSLPSAIALEAVKVPDQVRSRAAAA